MTSRRDFLIGGAATVAAAAVPALPAGLLQEAAVIPAIPSQWLLTAVRFREIVQPILDEEFNWLYVRLDDDALFSTASVDDPLTDRQP